MLANALIRKRVRLPRYARNDSFKYIMKNIIATLALSFLIGLTALAQQPTANFITTDIDNFWTAYDKITSTKDSATQYNYINQLFIAKGTPGLKAMMQARRYTAKSYIDAINQYPLFWTSLKPNTLKAKNYAADIAVNVSKLKALYPELKPSKIYFTIGAFRSGGTILDGMVLIGSEIALANEHTVTTEFPQDLNNLKEVFKSNSPQKIVFNNVHEYVHTQQKTTIGNYLLAQTVLEGVAEFVTEKATKQTSSLPAIAYGMLHAEKVKQAFVLQMFNLGEGYWLYSNDENEFGVRDLGYYVGYAICQKYYNQAKNKKQAVKAMIELDYNNDAALMNFVNQSGYFSKPVQVYKDNYESRRPVVTGIKQFKNNATNVDASISLITIEFSTVMDKQNRNFELGPLGMEHLLKVKSVKGFSDDGRSLTFEVDMKPGTRYQLTIGEGFRSQTGVRLKPYLINLETKP